jgi:thiosulfate dehydrogenase
MARNGLAVIILVLTVALFWFWRRNTAPIKAGVSLQGHVMPSKVNLWTAPDSNTIPHNDSGQLILYGKKLIHETAKYFGPQGSIGKNANGMNCQNCHLESGTRVWAGNFGSVASMYPRFSERRGSAETVNQRISDCFERSMNGMAPDSNSLEMKAMKSYILWVGKDVERGKKPAGTGLEPLTFLKRAADTANGRLVYIRKCQLCHGANGEGKPDSLNAGYLYPPLWGKHSYNTAAGLYRLTKFAPFVKANMPFGSEYDKEQLTVEEAWDLAAFVNSQPRPVKKFRQDWPNISLKPVDIPEGPYKDSYTSFQHKYGPFEPIARYKKEMASDTQNKKGL